MKLLFRFAPVLAVTTACYTYAPIESARLEPGMSVRARITATQAQQLEPLLGTADARLLDGTVVGVGDTVMLEVPSVVQADVGSSVQTLHQRVSIPRSALLEMETRTLDRFKTYMAAGIAGAVIGGWILRATVLNPGKEGLPGGGGPAEFRVPLIRMSR